MLPLLPANTRNMFEWRGVNGTNQFATSLKNGKFFSLANELRNTSLPSACMRLSSCILSVMPDSLSISCQSGFFAISSMSSENPSRILRRISGLSFISLGTNSSRTF